MKVKVSYTVDFDDIPNVVRDIVSNAEQLQEEMRGLSSGLHDGDLGVNSLKDINKLKNLASELAESYSDCESILSGFFGAVFNQQEQTEEQEGDNS